jgi:hypothetical protein
VQGSVFPRFVQPALRDSVREAVTGLALSWVAQCRRSPRPGSVGHAEGNRPDFLGLVGGARALTGLGTGQRRRARASDAARARKVV